MPSQEQNRHSQNIRNGMYRQHILINRVKQARSLFTNLDHRKKGRRTYIDGLLVSTLFYYLQ